MDVEDKGEHAKGRIFARDSRGGNYLTTDDKNPKSAKTNREEKKMQREKRERERYIYHIYPEKKNSKMAEKEMKMKRTRWPARYKKDDERRGLIPRNVI